MFIIRPSVSRGYFPRPQVLYNDYESCHLVARRRFTHTFCPIGEESTEESSDKAKNGHRKATKNSNLSHMLDYFGEDILWVAGPGPDQNFSTLASFALLCFDVLYIEVGQLNSSLIFSHKSIQAVFYVVYFSLSSVGYGCPWLVLDVSWVGLSFIGVGCILLDSIVFDGFGCLSCLF